MLQAMMALNLSILQGHGAGEIYKNLDLEAYFLFFHWDISKYISEVNNNAELHKSAPSREEIRRLFFGLGGRLRLCVRVNGPTSTYLTSNFTDPITAMS